jgi:lipopolysaccharide export LptBFGC system permease protein LptF
VDLRRRNEYGPMLGAGRSPGRVLLPVLAFAAAATVALVWAHDRIAPRALERRNGVERMIRGERRSATYRVPHVRDSAGNCWTILEWDPANAAATRVRVVPYRSGEREWDLLEVPVLRWREGPGGRGWYPEGGGRLLAGPGGEDGAPAADAPVDTDLRPEHIELARASSELEGLSARRLRALRERHPDLPHLAVLEHRRLTYPLANLVLVLVGVPLVLRGRGSSLFFPVLAALGVCAGFYAVDAAACDLGARGAVAPGLASWFATVLFASAGLALLDGAGEDG